MLPGRDPRRLGGFNFPNRTLFQQRVPSFVPMPLDDAEMAASPLFALGLCLDSSPLYYLAVAKRLQELHEFSSSSSSDEESNVAVDHFARSVRAAAGSYIEHNSPQLASNNNNRTNGQSSTHAAAKESNNNANHSSKTPTRHSPSPASSSTKPVDSAPTVTPIAVDTEKPSTNEAQDAYATDYRMSVRTVDDFLRLLTGAGALARNAVSYDGDTKIDALKTLQVGLYYLGCQETMEEIAQTFNLSQPSVAVKLVQSTIKAIAGVADQLIYWPTKRDAAQRQANALFTNSFGCNGTVGVIGWMPLAKTDTDNESLPVLMQAVVDHRLRFIDTACILPSGDDKDNLFAAFQQSQLAKKLSSSEKTRADMLPDDVHVLAPQLRGSNPSPVSWLVTRYAVNNAVPGEKLLTEKAFNRHLCHVASVTIQEAFRLVVRRFPRLRALISQQSNEAYDDVKATVLAAAVLHNFCVDRKEPLPKSAPRRTGAVLKVPGNVSLEPAADDEASPSSSENKRDKIATEITATSKQRSRSKKPTKK